MQRLVHSTALLLLSIGLAAQNADHQILFEVASDQLSDEEMLRATGFCRDVDRSKLRSVQITGHSDERGDAAYNHDLSQRRAQSVRDLLVDQCAFDAPVTIEWLGESASSKADHALDRRVDVRLNSSDVSFSEREHQHPRVKPLMPLADVPRERFKVNCSDAIEFIANDRVRVRIAPDAIVDRNGEAVTGDIDITYRSFSDPWAIIASGIPMHFGKGADAEHFESLGMFEVYASQAGEQVYLKEGEGISLTLPEEVERSDDFKDWMLNEATGEWVESTSRNTGTAVSTSVPGLTEACLKYERMIARLPAEPDTTVLLDRMESVDYCGIVPCSPAVRPYDKRKSRYISPYNAKEIPAVRLEMVRRSYIGRRWIGFTIHVDHASLREWRTFPKEMIWAYDGDLDHSAFRRTITKKHFYQDIVLQVDESGMKGNIKLKDRGEWITLPVDLSVHQGSEKDLVKWEKQRVTYEKAFNAKRVKFDDRVSNKWKAIQAQRDGIISSSWRSTRDCMNDDELAMDMEEFHDYAVQLIRQRAIQMMPGGDVAGVARSFVMDGFGIYNCDRFLRREIIQPVFVEVRDENDQVFPWTNAYAVLGGQKAVVSYWGNGSGTSNDLTLSKKISHMVFVDAKGELMIVNRPTDQIGNARATIRGRRFGQPEDPGALADLIATL